MKTILVKTTLVALTLTFLLQFQAVAAPGFSSVEFHRARIEKHEKEAQQIEKNILYWEDIIDREERKLTKETNRPIGPPVDEMGNPTTKAINKKYAIKNIRINIDSQKRTLRQKKDSLRATQSLIRSAQSDWRKALASEAKGERKNAERRAIGAKEQEEFARSLQANQTNPQVSPVGSVWERIKAAQRTSTDPQVSPVGQAGEAEKAALLKLKIPFPYSSYETWFKSGCVAPPYTYIHTGVFVRWPAWGSTVPLNKRVISSFELGRENWIKDKKYSRQRYDHDISNRYRWIEAAIKRAESQPEGKKMAWTFGGQQPNLRQWKGQSARNVMRVFGKPDDVKKIGYGHTDANWDYHVMNIRDTINGLHTRVRFEVRGGVVQTIKLLD